MLKNLFQIPDTFDPDDRRRRQVLNTLLLFFIVGGVAAESLTLLAKYTPFTFSNSGTEYFFIAGLWGEVLCVILLFTNRSPRVPAWFSSTAFIVLMIPIFSLSDNPDAVYNGRSTIMWAIPVIVGAIIFRPGYGFLIAAVICGLMQFFTLVDNQALNSANYYSMLVLFFIAYTSWLGMSIANRAIQDARRHAANLETILNSIADGVLVLDSQGSFISANPALLRMIPKDELAEICSKPLEKTISWKRKVFAVTASPVPRVGSVAVFRDETRRHEIERARDALIATVSHEFRTPLAAVMNYLEMLLMLSKMGKIDNEAFTEHLTRALESSNRLHHLIVNIIDLAQIQAGMLELKPQHFNLSALFEKSRQLLDALLNQKRLSYELSIAPDVPAEITGDPERLHQVLVNLIGNAIKFTNQGGVKVRVFLPQEGILSIEVADTGPGIPEEQLPDIFEVFRRGSNYVRRERQGAGLGLSITKEIITCMGGEISVSSALGVGSAFTVSLPCGGD